MPCCGESRLDHEENAEAGKWAIDLRARDLNSILRVKVRKRFATCCELISPAYCMRSRYRRGASAPWQSTSLMQSCAN
jgi:hypothetical protein